jgi:hypothetical protein
MILKIKGLKIFFKLKLYKKIKLKIYQKIKKACQKIKLKIYQKINFAYLFCVFL